jgi:hypothetical protein
VLVGIFYVYVTVPKPLESASSVGFVCEFSQVCPCSCKAAGKAWVRATANRLCIILPQAAPSEYTKERALKRIV